jgi:hypothetical protein
MFPLVIDDSALIGDVAVAEPLAALPPAILAPQPLVLRVSGAKPLRMEALLLVEAEAPPAARGAIGHALRLYQRAGGDIVVALRSAGRSGGTDDVVDRVEVFPDLDEASGWLEKFDPTSDLPIDLDASDRALTAAEVALRAAALRIRADSLVRRYRGLVGEALWRLEAAL